MTRPTLLGRGGWPLSGTLGGSVGVPPSSEPPPSCCSAEDPPDRAADEASNAVTYTAGVDEAVLVQYKATIALNGSTSEITLDSTPTPDNLLVLMFWTRDALGSVPTGFDVDSTSAIGGATAHAWVGHRVVQSGDTTSFGFGGPASRTGRYVLMEWAGVDVPDAIINDFATAFGDTTAQTFDPTGDGLALGMGAYMSDTVFEGLRTESPSTEVFEGDHAGTSFGPHASVGYGDDSVVMRVNDSNIISFSDRGVIVGNYPYITSDPAWNINAPKTVDADDSTYHLIPSTGTSTEVLRVDLGGEFRIVTSTLKIATATSGTKTYYIKGANEVDFSDEVLLATFSFSAVGSFAMQTIETTWYTTASYRYFELTGTDESRRIHAWELYEATLATNHQHSLINLSDVSGTPNPAEVLAYSSNTQLWQPRSAVLNVTSNASNTLTNPFLSLVSGDGIAFAAASNTLTISSTVAGGGGGSTPLSYGSNASHVAEVSLVGIESAVARADHYHAGVAQVTASSSNTLQRGTVNLRPGDNISFGLTDGDSDGEFDTLTIHGAAGGGGGSLTVADEGTPLSTAATTLDFVGAGVVASGTGATKTITIAGGGSFDPIENQFGTPDTAFEFATSSLTGLTALGTVGAEDADTTFPGAYYLYNNTNASPYMRGRSLDSLTAPFTAITLVSTNASRNYEQAGLLIAPSTYPGSGGLEFLGLGTGTSANRVGVEVWSGAGSYSSTPANTSFVVVSPVYLAIVVNSATDVDYLWSKDGVAFYPLAMARNPGFTPTQVAMVSACQNTTGFGSVFEYLRVWNSALTFPGAA